jgi:hypothetical protein
MIIQVSDELSDNRAFCICLPCQPINHVSLPFTTCQSHRDLTRFRDGKSNYMEGLMLLTLYVVIALACELPFEPLNHNLIAC